jgi:hypothetical protein
MQEGVLRKQKVPRTSILEMVSGDWIGEMASGHVEMLSKLAIRKT